MRFCGISRHDISSESPALKTFRFDISLFYYNHLMYLACYPAAALRFVSFEVKTQRYPLQLLLIITDVKNVPDPDRLIIPIKRPWTLNTLSQLLRTKDICRHD